MIRRRSRKRSVVRQRVSQLLVRLRLCGRVRIDIGGAVVTSSITNEAVDELKLAAGQDAYAVIKASDVMVAID